MGAVVLVDIFSYSGHGLRAVADNICCAVVKQDVGEKAAVQVRAGQAAPAPLPEWRILAKILARALSLTVFALRFVLLHEGPALGAGKIPLAGPAAGQGQLAEAAALASQQV